MLLLCRQDPMQFDYAHVHANILESIALQFTVWCKKQWLQEPLVSLQMGNKMGARGWSCQNHRTTGRKHSLTDGCRQCRSGRRSRWERHKAFYSDWGGRECVISQGAKPCSPAKARPRQAERGCLCLSWEIQGLKMKQWRGAPTEAESDG